MSDNIVAPSINRYIKMFATTYCITVFVVVIIRFFYNSQFGSPSLVSNMASILTVYSFLTENKRAPDLNEKRTLIWMSIGIELVVYALLEIISIFLFSEMTSTLKTLLELPVGLRLFTFFLVIAFQYFNYWLIYGWVAKFVAKKFK